jgi:hypothetical protein
MDPVPGQLRAAVTRSVSCPGGGSGAGNGPDALGLSALPARNREPRQRPGGTDDARPETAFGVAAAALLVTTGGIPSWVARVECARLQLRRHGSVALRLGLPRRGQVSRAEDLLASRARLLQG